MDDNGSKQGKTEKLSTYVEPDVKERIEALAKEGQRSVAGEVRLAVITHLEATK